MCEETKVCTQCGVEKDICEFGSNKNKKGEFGIRCNCKKCGAESRRKFYKENKARILERQKLCPSNQKDKKQEYNKSYRAANLETLREKEKQYSRDHRGQRVEYLREYYSQKKEVFKTDPDEYKKFRNAANKRRKQQELNDPSLRIGNNLRRSMNLYFHKQLSTFDIIGCTYDEFQEWIKFQLKNHPDLELDKYGAQWHIDHCLPCASFELTITDEQYKCYHWSNLSPLKADDNISKSDTISQEHLNLQLAEYNEYIAQKFIIDSKWSINNTYRAWIDGASTTITSEKSEDETRGNDLGSNNVEDWATRSQDTLYKLIERLECQVQVVAATIAEIRQLLRV